MLKGQSGNEVIPMDKNKRLIKQRENILKILKEVSHVQPLSKEEQGPYFSKVGGKYIPHKK